MSSRKDTQTDPLLRLYGWCYVQHKQANSVGSAGGRTAHRANTVGSLWGLLLHTVVPAICGVNSIHRDKDQLLPSAYLCDSSAWKIQAKKDKKTNKQKRKKAHTKKAIFHFTRITLIRNGSLKEADTDRCKFKRSNLPLLPCIGA